MDFDFVTCVVIIIIGLFGMFTNHMISRARKRIPLAIRIMHGLSTGLVFFGVVGILRIIFYE